MYTQCPSCETVYRITIDQLRRAEGEVRCGRCQALFNAVLRLTDHLPESAQGELGTGVYPSPKAGPPPEAPAAPESQAAPESAAAPEPESTPETAPWCRDVDASIPSSGS